MKLSPDGQVRQLYAYQESDWITLVESVEAERFSTKIRVKQQIAITPAELEKLIAYLKEKNT